MVTRRAFLSATAAAPFALAALTSRRAEAQPITAGERLARIHHAQELMAQHRIGVICLAGGASLTYFTGLHWYLSERAFLAFVPARGEPFLICPAFEEGRAHEQIAANANLKDTAVFTWQEDEDPYALAASCLKARALASETIGIEEQVPFVFANGIARAATAATITSATPVTAGCRMRKSAAELALMRLASSVTLQVYEYAWRSVRDGMSNVELSALIAAAYDKVGFPGDAMVQTGAYTALPHGSRREQIIREGSLVLMDDGCSVEGYQSDITRTFVFGRATDRMKRVFDIVGRAQDAALSAARPGVACQAVDAAARNVITGAGYGPGYKYFLHRLGHGIGLDGHEWPYLVRGNTLPLARGMTFSDEPGIYIPGEFGIRLEDDMYVTESGAQLFTPQSHSLEQPFAA